MDHANYPNPPIAEAVCQFDFEEPLAWTVVTPGVFYQKLSDQYPAEPDQQEQVQAVFGPSADGLSPEFSINRSANRYIYRDESLTRLVVLSPGSISVNSLRPYEGWPQLHARAQSAIQLLSGIAQIPLISKVSLRYINQIRLGAGGIELNDYIKIPVQAAAFDGAVVGAFVIRTESLLPSGVKVIVTFASVAPPTGDEETANVILDIDCVQQFDSSVDAAEALAAVDALKEIENNQFEALITDECRRLFK